MRVVFTAIAALGAFLLPLAASASTEGTAGHTSSFPLVFLFIVIMLMAARVGALVERFHQPAVLGELFMGLVLAALAFLPGLHAIHDLAGSELVIGIAEIGVILLLFRTGLESNVEEMKAVGLKATMVALVGVALPFLGGYLVSKLLIPGLDNNTYIFIGAVLTATSVGITARVYKDLGVLKLKESQIVLGAAVIDDVLGLIILAVVSGIVSAGTVHASTIVILCVKALVFLALAVVIGKTMAPRLGRWFSHIHSGVGMKMALALAVCALFAWAAAALAGLAPIVGAFAAGLVLDSVHFDRFHKPRIAVRLREWCARLKRCPQCDPLQTVTEEMDESAHLEEDEHIENLIESVGNFFIPIFFVYTGLQVNLAAFANPKTVGIALAITMVAILGKALAGFAAGKGVSHKIIGFGMVPRGEVGLIFANVGRQLGVINDQVFAVTVIVVILTTMITPPILGHLIRKQPKAVARSA
jgi:Kef-type K+ transport system membrane component KefB